MSLIFLKKLLMGLYLLEAIVLVHIGLRSLDGEGPLWAGWMAFLFGVVCLGIFIRRMADFQGATKGDRCCLKKR